MDTAPGPESAGRSPDGKPYPGSCLPDVHSILICCCAVLKPGDKDYEKYKDMDGKLGWIEVSDALCMQNLRYILPSQALKKGLSVTALEIYAALGVPSLPDKCCDVWIKCLFHPHILLQRCACFTP